MKESKTTTRPSLSGQRDLILHTYDLFKTSQARIFTLSTSIYDEGSGELDRSINILCLDDIILFSVSARRLIELTRLKSFANRQLIAQQHFDKSEHVIKLYPLKRRVGFLTLINEILHSTFIELYRNRFDYQIYFEKRPLSNEEAYARIMLYGKIRQENRWAEYAVSPAMAIISDHEEMNLVLLKDVISASVPIIEKISDVCSDSNIMLEAEFR
jgi:hypothetical protein